MTKTGHMGEIEVKTGTIRISEVDRNRGKYEKVIEEP